jgi:hypothetical protein
MVFTLEDPRRGLGPSESVIRTISSRIAGGGIREVNSEPPRVSHYIKHPTLSLKYIPGRRRHARIPIESAFDPPSRPNSSRSCHAYGGRLHPHTRDCRRTKERAGSREQFYFWEIVSAFFLRVCVGKFNFWWGRYTQCEMMTAHYKQPVLLIEFEENKSFSLEVSPTSLPITATHFNPSRHSKTPVQRSVKKINPAKQTTHPTIPTTSNPNSSSSHSPFRPSASSGPPRPTQQPISSPNSKRTTPSQTPSSRSRSAPTMGLATTAR